MWKEAGTLVIGPGHEILARTGDKLQARLLAEECEVPVLPALKDPTSDVVELQKFADSAGYPIIIKAVDGGRRERNQDCEGSEGYGISSEKSLARKS